MEEGAGVNAVSEDYGSETHVASSCGNTASRRYTRSANHSTAPQNSANSLARPLDGQFGFRGSTNLTISEESTSAHGSAEKKEVLAPRYSTPLTPTLNALATYAPTISHNAAGRRAIHSTYSCRPTAFVNRRIPLAAGWEAPYTLHSPHPACDRPAVAASTDSDHGHVDVHDTHARVYASRAPLGDVSTPCVRTLYVSCCLLLAVEGSSAGTGKSRVARVLLAMEKMQLKMRTRTELEMETQLLAFSPTLSLPPCERPQGRGRVHGMPRRDDARAERREGSETPFDSSLACVHVSGAAPCDPRRRCEVALYPPSFPARTGTAGGDVAGWRGRRTHTPPHDSPSLPASFPALARTSMPDPSFPARAAGTGHVGGRPAWGREGIQVHTPRLFRCRRVPVDTGGGDAAAVFEVGGGGGDGDNARNGNVGQGSEGDAAEAEAAHGCGKTHARSVVRAPAFTVCAGGGDARGLQHGAAATGDVARAQEDARARAPTRLSHATSVRTQHVRLSFPPSFLPSDGARTSTRAGLVLVPAVRLVLAARGREAIQVHTPHDSPSAGVRASTRWATRPWSAKSAEAGAEGMEMVLGMGMWDKEDAAEAEAAHGCGKTHARPPPSRCVHLDGTGQGGRG
ncbi:hypothetical protein B0H19DRAFT_1062879 [Mycena capillaripes]|nr:hypothetical protein B0H19DRAFT_1062879 [Mycena capillaripes]